MLQNMNSKKYLISKVGIEEFMCNDFESELCCCCKSITKIIGGVHGAAKKA